MMSNNARQIGLNWWKGCQTIVIDEVAGSIPSSFLNEILYRCSESGATLELCVFSGEAQQNLTVCCLLRCEDRSRYAVIGRLYDLTQSLLPRFEEAGFRVHTAQPNDPATGMINRFFGGDVAPCCVGKGFFPEDKLAGPRQYYIPGHYARENCDPISWDRLASIISRYPASMMCIQLINTVLAPAEVQFLQNYKNYLSTFKNDYAAAQACMAYDQKLKMAGQRMYFINVFCVGSDPFTCDISAQMRAWKYRTFNMPPQILQEGGHLYLGEGRFKSITTEYGHMAECKKASLAYPGNQFQRLNHLIAMDTVPALFPLPYDPARIPFLKVKPYSPKAVMIPRELQYRKDAQMIYIGRQEGNGALLGVPAQDLVRHGFIVGKSGCGKTTFAMGLLHQLHQLDIPFLVVEPAKNEYRSLRSVIPELQVYTPGVSDVSPIQLNPFLPPRGVTLEEYLPALSTIFAAAISMDHPLDVIFPQVIRVCYNRYGWRDTSTRDSMGARPFGLSEFAQCYRDYIRDAYAKDPTVRANLEAAGVVRLTQLTSEHPVLFDTVNSLDFDEVLSRPTVIELDAINNNQQRSLIMMTILVQAELCIRKRSTMDSKLKNVIMIDEAHLLLGQAAPVQKDAVNSSSACIRHLQEMVKILRSYGTGVFFGDQSPEKLTGDIMEHVNLKIMFQQDSVRDRSILAALTRMDQGMQEDLIGLPPGCGYVFLSMGLEKPVRIQAPNYKKELALRDDITDDYVARMMNVRLAAPFPECASCNACAAQCDPAMRSDARFIANRIFASDEMNRALLEEEQMIHLQAFSKSYLVKMIASCMAEQGITWRDQDRLRDCVAVHLIRLLKLSDRCRIDPQQLTAIFFTGRPTMRSPGINPIGGDPQRRSGSILGVSNSAKPGGDTPENGR